MHLKLKRTPGIFLTGFMGAGKTTVGRIVAEKLGWDFVDLDDQIQDAQGASVPEIFGAHGEPVFRRMEADALRKLVNSIQRGNPSVVALGGGAFLTPENFDLLETAGLSIWLECSFETAYHRAMTEGGRPLARDPERFRQLFLDRQSGYARADFRVDAEAEPASVADAVLKLPIWK